MPTLGTRPAAGLSSGPRIQNSEYGRWLMVDGSSRQQSIAIDSTRLLAAGSRQSAVGCRQGAAGSGMLDVGCWTLAAGPLEGARRRSQRKKVKSEGLPTGGGVAMARVSPADCQGVRVHPDEYGYRIPLGRQSASPCRVAAVRSFKLVNRPILKPPIMPTREE